MTTKQEILEYLSSKKEELSTKYGLSKLGLTGSYAIGNQSRSSAIDIFIEFTPNSTDLLDKTKDLRKALEDRFSTKIDIWREKYVKHYYKKGIFKPAILV